MSLVRTWFIVNARAILLGLIALVLLFQFAGFVSVLSTNIDPRSILSSRDSDASHIVGTADLTRWYKDNGEAPYGAFYFRVAHTFNQLAGRDFALPSSVPENRERAQHLVVMVMSLICVFSIAYLLVALVFTALEARLIATAALTAIFLDEFIWCTFVFRGHPDMMLTLCVLIAFLATTRALDSRETDPTKSVWFYLSALAWGICGMVKLTFVVFLPVLVFLWMPPFSKVNLRRTIKYYLWLFPSYILSALPQSLNIPRPIKFLMHQWDYNLPPDMASFNMWVDSFKSQMYRPLAVILVLAVLSPVARRPFTRWRVLPLIVFPLAIFFHQKNEYEARYYLMPFVSMILAWLALTVRWPKVGHYFRRARNQIAVAAVLMLVVLATIGLVSRRMEAELQPTLACRPDFTRLYERIHAEIEKGHVFILDPYIPFDRARAGERAFGDWSNDWALVQKRHSDAVVLNTPYGREFSPGPPGHTRQVDSPNWSEMTKYYASFLGKTETTDPTGATWERILASDCGYEMWMKK